MKIFISVDLEGIAGTVDWSQGRIGGAAYEQGCRLMLGEVNAAIDGILDAGEAEIVINDSHGKMFNLDPEAIHGEASYISGGHKPMYMMQGLDASFDAQFLIGYHGSISGPPSVLSHTYNPEVFSGVRVNGQYVGESGINALVGAHYGVPIAFVSGDQVTAAELEGIAPDVVSVQTKTSVSRFAAENLHPTVSRRLIRAAAADAVASVAAGSLAAPRIAAPATVDIDFQTADMAEIATWVAGVERSGQRSVAIVGSDLLAIYRSFVAVTYITRQVGGR
ncbi:M55 family metallopeptidase [Gryllotalpicola reticulitermitis]|uniref:M55 family metallopeptidase n=1 Tax=Gryllotalpicola reticulitermitis TaxID=1184153 RepID=A0ABV8Q480_9MICO